MDDCALCAADSRAASTAPHSMASRCSSSLPSRRADSGDKHNFRNYFRISTCAFRGEVSSVRAKPRDFISHATPRNIAVCVPAARRRGMAGAARPALAFPKPAKACRCVCLRRVHGEAGLAHSQTTSLGKRKIFKSANLPSAQLISRFPPAHRLQTSCRESLRRISRPSTRGCSCALLR